MPNKNYLAGRRFEYEVMKHLRDSFGYKVLRTAGSHGEFDIIAYRSMTTIFIQCKVVETEAEAKRLSKAWRENPPNPPALVRFQQQLLVKIKGSSGWETTSV